MSDFTLQRMVDVADGLRRQGEFDAAQIVEECITLRRERESAKAAVMKEMIKKAYDIITAHLDGFGGPLLEGTQAALEAVAPMLANARVPDANAPLDKRVLRAFNAMCTWGGPKLTQMVNEALAAAPKPETEE